ncbi:hypothetical protein INT47_005395 [Mucor saturninus]|uniref:Tc1-like transposase DDE domain-containing protein n=1 Tax=Mucor saturninus TaxID=64648 RepID=A0A8H7UWW5_9FUNG|nr:hypothetical protein INT47_005395 [Mucor saturninus]
MDYLSNCIFLDELSTARSAKGTPAIVTTLSIRAVNHTILGATSAMGVVNIEMRLSNMKLKRIKVDGARKRKQPQPKKALSKGIVTGHYMLSLQNTMNLMNQYPNMKDFYIVMDNAPILIADDIEQMITKRGYRSIYLPPYLLELNPIDNFWSTMKSYVKRSTFGGEEDFKAKVTKASNGARATTLLSMSQHSVSMFDKCLRMEPI